MLNKIAEFFWRIAGLKTFLAALAIYLVFGLYIMPTGLKQFREIAGKKVEVIDLQFAYTPEQVRTIIAEYGEPCRKFAANFELIDDGLYPVAYTFLFLMIMGWVFKSLAAYGVGIRYIHLMPFLVMAADYSENACIITMLNNYPNFSDKLAWTASLFTSLKWSLLGLETLIIAIAVWMLTFYRMTKGKRVLR